MFYLCDSTGLNRDARVYRYFVCWVEFDELYFSHLLINA